MDSKINGIQAHIAKENASTSRWTAHHRLYDRYFFKCNGIDQEQQVECLQDEICPAPIEEPPAAHAPRAERPAFSNQPLKGLENLKLF